MDNLIEPLYIKSQYTFFSVFHYNGKAFYVNSRGRSVRTGDKCILVGPNWIESGNYSGGFSGSTWQEMILESLAEKILGRPFAHAYTYNGDPRPKAKGPFDDATTISKDTWCDAWNAFLEEVRREHSCEIGDILHCRTMKAGQIIDLYFQVPPEGLSNRVLLPQVEQ